MKATVDVAPSSFEARLHPKGGFPMLSPRIDHVVIDVRDGIDEAARRYAALGFHLTERANHSLGSSNHLCMFGSDYVELLSAGGRRELAGFPVGLNGLVFAMTDAQAFYEEQLVRDVPVQPVLHFSRRVDLADGQRAEASFNVVRLESQAGFDGRIYFCDHLTPNLVWRPEWQNHPNGAVAIQRIAISIRDPDSVADILDRIFGSGAVVRSGAPDGPRVLMAEIVAVELWPQGTLARVLGDVSPYPASQAEHIGLIGIRVGSLRKTEETLRANGIHNIFVEPGRVMVPPAEALNVALEFVE
jgi:Glyoxalase-like domain